MQIYDTLRGKKSAFRPLGDHVKMYVCGVTPYADTHVGHAMSYIVFDVIQRYLEHLGYAVTRVQNFTDIDDKIIARAEQLGTDPRELAERYMQNYLEDMDALNIRRASAYPRATDEIQSILVLVEGLVAKGQAYAVDGDVYFRVDRWPSYGALSRRSLATMEAGARVEVDQRKEHPMDFALWKAAKPGEPSWPSPWGQGRPGWHIECSAMALRHLGQQIDIHGGGQDLVFPHHENEIAQTEAYTGLRPVVNFWMHNGLMQLGGEKMSKSLGNLVTVRELLKSHSADALRLFVLSSYYRSPVTFSEDALEAAERGLDRIRTALRSRPDDRGAPADVPESPCGEDTNPVVHGARARFSQAMDDDFGTPAAVAELFELVKEVNRQRETGAPTEHIGLTQDALLGLARILGFSLAETAENDLTAMPFVDLLVDLRSELRRTKQWALADRIRTDLSVLGITIEDRPEGTVWHQE